MKKVIAVIPARYNSSRFPGKPLAMIAGKAMIQRVYEQVKQVNEITKIIVATDDIRIFDAVAGFGGNAVMTGFCNCGTERVYEAVRSSQCDVVVNIQGDEPLIEPEMIRELISVFENDHILMATLCKEITDVEDINNPNIVKVIRDINGDALYFSRYGIPFNRDGREDIKHYKHIGIYGYTKDFLGKYVKLPKSFLENAENLEQLRALEHGFKIKVKETVFDSWGVDTPEDILKTNRKIMEKETYV